MALNSQQPAIYFKHESLRFEKFLAEGYEFAVKGAQPRNEMAAGEQRDMMDGRIERNRSGSRAINLILAAAAAYACLSSYRPHCRFVMGPPSSPFRARFPLVRLTPQGRVTERSFSMKCQSRC